MSETGLREGNARIVTRRSFPQRLAVAACLIGALSVDWSAAQDEPLEPGRKKPRTVATLNALDADDDKLPTLKEAFQALPSAEAMLTIAPFDWVVLKPEEKSVVTGTVVTKEIGEERVITVEPLTPRPRLLETLEQELKEYAATPPPGDPAALKEFRGRQEKLLKFRVLLYGLTDDNEYLVETKFTKEILYFEDVLLRALHRELDAGRVASAYDLLWYVERRQADWPRADDAHRRLLLVEAQQFAARGDPDSALPLLEQLFEHPPKATKTPDRLDDPAQRRLAEEIVGQQKLMEQAVEAIAAVVDRLMDRSLARHDPREARHFLHRLMRWADKHATTVRRRNDLQKRTEQLLDSARKAAAAKDYRTASQLAERASRFWPATPSLRDAHRELTLRHQIAIAGVVRPADLGVVDAFPAREDVAARHLRDHAWFEPREVGLALARYRSRIFEEWEPIDLGRRFRLTVRRRLADWESIELPAASELVDRLEAALRPESLDFDDRIAGWTRGVAMTGVDQMEVAFDRSPLRPESFLADLRWGRNSRFTAEPLSTAPIELQVAGGSDAGPQREEKLAVKLASQTNTAPASDVRWSYRRIRPQPDAAPVRRLAELQWREFSTDEDAIQSLLRAETSILPWIDLIDVAKFRADNRFHVLQYRQPETHVVQCRMDHPALRLAELRRALNAAIPRADLLRTHVLRGADPGLARLTATPLPSGNLANHKLLPLPEHSANLAASLALAARQAFGQDWPELRLACPNDRRCKAICEELILGWKRAGIAVRFMTPDDDRWDLAYRRVSLTDPWAELWPLATHSRTAAVVPLLALKQSVRQRFLDTEQATSWDAASRMLVRLQADLAQEAWMAPLWEVEQFWVGRRNLSELPERPLHPFDQVERWIVPAWYPTETP